MNGGWHCFGVSCVRAGVSVSIALGYTTVGIVSACREGSKHYLYFVATHAEGTQYCASLSDTGFARSSGMLIDVSWNASSWRTQITP